jgi:tight adherence protein C
MVMAALARMDMTTLIIAMIIVGVLLLVVIYALSIAMQGKRSKRIKSVIRQHRGDMSAMQMEGLQRESSIRGRRKQTHVELAQKFVSSLNLAKYLAGDEVKEQLAQAGLRGRTALTIYMTMRVLLIGVGGVVTIIGIGMMNDFPYPEFVKFLFAAGGAVVGFYLPKIMISNMAQKRQEEMIDVFPDALDLLLICVESGLGIEAAFQRVTEEIMESSPTLAQELGLTSAELAYLGDRKHAYENFTKRTGLEVVKALSTTLIQSEEYGTPVAVALKVLSQEKRDERMSAAEKKAAALPAKLTVPMIIFFLPVLFVVVIGPAALSL